VFGFEATRSILRMFVPSFLTAVTALPCFPEILPKVDDLNRAIALKMKGIRIKTSATIK
jgi:hypothetical protein